MAKVVKDYRTPELSGFRGELLGSSRRPGLQLRGPKSADVETEEWRRRAWLLG